MNDYNAKRTHLSLNKDSPLSRTVERAGRILCRPILGGLHHNMSGFDLRQAQVFFSHPADFTPVCTSEFVAFSKAYDRFQALGCDLLALSVDSLFSHIAWVRSIHERFGVTVPFPITDAPPIAIAAAYGMIHPDSADSSTVRPP